MQPELVISCDQARLPMKIFGHQHSQITFNLHSVLPMGCARIRVKHRLWECPNNDWSSLRSMPPLTLPEVPGHKGPVTSRIEANITGGKIVNAMMPKHILLYYQSGDYPDCHQRDSSSNWQKQMQRPTVNHLSELWESC